ncbi:MAG: type I restriction-modification enzyme R subunit C-terminal domain-containing protein, partial [Verrucomicrobiota bacterium]
YKYFGDPVYIYSLKEGINDGFLTPFKVKRIKTTLDDYIYTSDDDVIEGEVETGRIYEEHEFNVTIEIKQREAYRVKLMMAEIKQKEKTLVFCATQAHAALVRDLINQQKQSSDPNYCQRVTANDGELGEQHLRDFQDNEKTIPTILTTSKKLSTGVDARNIRNIVLLRPIKSMIEFKQIIGRGTRLFEGKDFFTIYDFVDAYKHFADPEWDGEPIEPETKDPRGPRGPGPDGPPPEPPPRRQKIRIKLSDGKERELQHMISTSFWSADGRPVSAQEFLQNLYGALPSFFASEAELRTIWSSPITRKTLLDKLADAGFGAGELATLQSLVNAEKSDLFDVLEYVAYATPTITREMRVQEAQTNIFAMLNDKQKEFLEFVLCKYIQDGVGELDQEKLPALLTQKYQALEDAQTQLGNVTAIRATFIEFQKHLYEKKVA